MDWLFLYSNKFINSSGIGIMGIDQKCYTKTSKIHTDSDMI